MVRDLQNQYLKPGQISRVDVFELLGQPDVASVLHGKDCVEYYVGWCSGLRFDPDGLLVCFDEDERLKSAISVQH